MYELTLGQLCRQDWRSGIASGYSPQYRININTNPFLIAYDRGSTQKDPFLNVNVRHSIVDKKEWSCQRRFSDNTSTLKKGWEGYTLK